MIRQRPDLHFYIVTKRPERFCVNLPNDWGEGYDNVTVACTVENQRRADERLPLFRELPIRHKAIICEPLLGPIDFRGWLAPSAYATSPINRDAQRCEQVTVGGESGREARVCDFDWVLRIRQQCVDANVPFHFKQTGANFRKEGREYHIPRRLQMEQARKADIGFLTETISGRP